MLIEQDADAPGLRQDSPDQLQLPAQRRIAPEQTQARRLGIGETLARLQAADAQHQRRGALRVLQAPVETRQIEQDQAQAGRQFARCGQAGQRLKAHVVGRAQFTQCLNKSLHAGAFLGTGQQNIGRLHRDAVQPRGQKQAEPGQPVAKGWRLP